MPGEPKPQTAAVLYRALAAVNGPGAPEPLDDASLLHVPGKSGMAGTYQGREPILQLLTRMTDLTGRTLRLAPSCIFTVDNRMVVVCGHVSAHRHPRQLETGMAYVVVLRNGHVREMWLAHQDQEAFDDFWH